MKYISLICLPVIDKRFEKSIYLKCVDEWVIPLWGIKTKRARDVMKRIILCVMMVVLCLFAVGTACAVDESDFTIENGVLTKYNGTATEVVIPDGVTSIGNNAFDRCKTLTSITIPDSVTSIGDSAFKSCTSLTSITIPNSVTMIGNEAFSFCESLTSITIPNGVTKIGYEAFYDCTKLTSITMPNSVTNIDRNVFSFCESLSSITIPNSITSISSGAFDGCTSLTSITIPNSVKSIGDSAFKSCTSLTSITIPNSVTSIGDFAFLFCTNLVIKTGYGSAAYNHAKDNGIQVELLQDEMVGHSVSLSDVVDLIFYFRLYSNPSAPLVTIRYGNGAEESAQFSSDLVKVENGETLYGVKCTMPIKKMSDLITVKVTYGDTTTSYSYSVKKYCESLLEESNASISSEKEKEVARELLKYADWAIYYFDYEPLVNGTIGVISTGGGGTNPGGGDVIVDPGTGGGSIIPGGGGITYPVNPGEGGITYPVNPGEGGITYPVNPGEGGITYPVNPGEGGGIVYPGTGGTEYQRTEPDISALSSADDVLTDLANKSTMTIQNGFNRSVKFDGVSLVLESSIRYRAYFTFADEDTAQSYIEMATDGNELIRVGNTNQYYIEKDSTSIEKLGEDMIFQLGDITITSNPLYYIELSLWSDSGEDLKHLCIAIYDYYSAVMEMIQAR